LSKAEDGLLEEIYNSLKDPQFQEALKSLPDLEKVKLNEYIRNVVGHIKSRRESERRAREYKYTKWDVVEEVDIDSQKYRLMKRIGRAIVEEKIDDEDQQNNKMVVKWNPIKEINDYRRSGDIFRHIDFPIGFYMGVCFKYRNVMSEYIPSGGKYPILKEACKLIN
jgi:hypothetical protein